MAELNLQAFKKAIRRPARPTHFRVQINFPGNTNSETDSFFCKGAQVPSSTITPVELSFFGRKAKFSGDKSYDEMSLTIYNDIGFTIRKKFETWIELMDSTVGNIGEDDWTQTQRDVYIFHLDGQKNVIKQYILKNAWPTTPGDAIDLNWDNESQGEEYSISLAYDYWESPDTTK